MNSWAIYLIASVLVWVFTYGLLRKHLPLNLRMFIFVTLAVVLAVPAAVSETQALAPAWFIVVFESIFGEQVIALQALKPLGFSLVVAYIALLIRLYFKSSA